MRISRIFEEGRKGGSTARRAMLNESGIAAHFKRFAALFYDNGGAFQKGRKVSARQAVAERLLQGSLF
jgi:hypothetical protein